jgi:hypothetical protein
MRLSARNQIRGSRVDAMLRSALGLVVVLASASAWAQEPVGCDKFKWPLDAERALLAKATPVVSGATLTAPLLHAVTVTLVPFADVKLPMPPQRAPKAAGSTAGFLRVARHRRPAPTASRCHKAPGSTSFRTAASSNRPRSAALSAAAACARA